MHDPIAAIELIVAGVADEAAQAWLRDGLARWLRSRGDVALTRILRLPSTPAGVRRAVRARWLTEAAGALPGALTAWQAASVLSEAVRRFEARKWPAWRTLPLPPSEATSLEVSLFYARRAGPLPASAQAYLPLTKSREKLSGDNATVQTLPVDLKADHAPGQHPLRRLRPPRARPGARACEA